MTTDIDREKDALVAQIRQTDAQLQRQAWVRLIERLDELLKKQAKEYREHRHLY